MLKNMYKVMAVALALVPIAAAQPAHVLRVQQAGAENNSFAYGFGDQEKNSYLGIGPRDVTQDRVAQLKLKEESGVEVVTVDADAPASKAGLREHDVILTINGAKMESVEQLRRTVRETPPGRSITLGVSRDGQFMNVTAQLEARPSHVNWQPKSPAPFPPFPPIPPMAPDIWVNGPSSLGVGIVMESLTPQLAEFLGVKAGNGTLIRSVDKDTPAAKSGLRAGDVIVSVDKDPVRESSDLYNTLRAKRGSTVSLGVIRDKREIKLSLAVPEKHTSMMLRHKLDLSADAPDRDVHIEMPDMDEVNTQIAMAGPAMEQAQREMQRIQPELEKIGPEVEKAMQEADVQKALAEAAQEMSSEKMQSAAAEIEKAMQDARPAMERAQRAMESHQGELARQKIEKIDVDKQMRKLQQDLRKVKPLEFHFSFTDGDHI